MSADDHSVASHRHHAHGEVQGDARAWFRSDASAGRTPDPSQRDLSPSSPTVWGVDEPSSLTHVLVADVSAAVARYEAMPSQASLRRDVVRTISAAMEGLHWQLKVDLLALDDQRHALSAGERALLAEETYALSDNGKVRTSARRTPLPAAIRLVVHLVERQRPGYSVDFTHPGWNCLQRSVAVRHRVVHPKSLEDLQVADPEIEEAVRAFHWLLALAIEVLRELNNEWSLLRSQAIGTATDTASGN